jgi:hypothetical protein
MEDDQSISHLRMRTTGWCAAAQVCPALSFVPSAKEPQEAQWNRAAFWDLQLRKLGDSERGEQGGRDRDKGGEGHLEHLMSHRLWTVPAVAFLSLTNSWEL